MRSHLILSMKILLPLLAACLLISKPCLGVLVISGVVDGTNAGGNPKAIELVALGTIADLSTYYIHRDTNGTEGGPFTVAQTSQLPSLSLSPGDFYYLYGNADSETALTGLGFSSGSVDSIAGQNGDDIFAVSTSSDPSSVADFTDAFGLLGQGDTDFAADSIAYRMAGTAPNATGVMDAGNFNMIAYSDSALQSTFGTYVVPEPSTTGLLVLGSVCFIARRRRA